MKASYLILALWTLSFATLRQEGRDNIAAINHRQIRSVFDLIPQANNQEDGKEKKAEVVEGVGDKKYLVKGNMFKKSITKIMRKKIKKWFRTERENLSSLRFLEDMKVFSDHLDEISKRV